MENDEDESNNFYDVVQDDDDDDDDVIDAAVAAIDKEDELFANNADKLDINGDTIDLELLEQYKTAQLLGRKTRIVEQRWRSLCDHKTHTRLQNAASNHLFGHIDDE